MKQILIELDDRSARDLLELDRDTEKAYRARPLSGAVEPADILGWDPANELAELTALG